METVWKQPEMVGRGKELSVLQDRFEDAVKGRGVTVYVSGEAGLGKTRLVSELIDKAEKAGALVIRGWCLTENLEPLMPMREALRNSDMYHLISGHPPPRIISVYLMDNNGMLVNKAERKKTELDPDIFASMLSAVGNFVTDSMANMGKSGKGLNSIKYGKYTILMETFNKATLVCVIKGTPNEFLIDDMLRVLKEVEGLLEDWDGRASKAAALEPHISWFVRSKKYDGEFLVDDPKLKQENLFDNVLLGMQRISTERALVLFMDDLQWADQTTLGLLHYLARNTKGNRVLILGTYRPEDIMKTSDGHPHQLDTVMQNMSRENLLEKIELKRLGIGDTCEVIRSVLGKVGFGQGLMERIHKETEGNPFFILEVVKLLAEEGQIKKDSEEEWADIDRVNIPSKVYDVITRRLDRLMSIQREILECASIEGLEFRSHVVGKTLEMDRLTLLKNLGDIEKTHRLIHSLPKKYRFDHTKITEVLYNGIMEELRAEFHRLVGDSIRELYKDDIDEVINELAYHYHRAGDHRASEYLVKAGDNARERYANSEAIDSYRLALETALEDEDRVRVLEALGHIYATRGNYGEAVDHFTDAGKLAKNMEAKVRNLRKIGEIHEKSSDFKRLWETTSKTKELLGGENSAEKGRILVVEGNAHWKSGDLDTAMKYYTDALDIFNKFESERDVGNALRAMGNIHLSRGGYDQGLACYRNSLEVMERLEDMTGIASALNNIGIVYMDLGEWEKAQECNEGSLEIEENIGNKWGIAQSLNNMGIIHSGKGELELALESYQRSLEIKEKLGDTSGVAAVINNIGGVYLDKGEYRNSIELFQRSLEIREKVGNKWSIAESLNNMGEVLSYMGQPKGALGYYLRSLSYSQEVGDKILSIHLCSGISEVYLGMNELQKALEYAERAVETAQEISSGRDEGIACRSLGKVFSVSRNFDKAAEELDSAESIFTGIGDDKELAKTCYEYAIHLERKGEREGARVYTERALKIFRNMGMVPWVDKCTELF